MSLLGVLDAAVSGMAGQSQKLTNVGGNISNSDTVGYKQASTEFASMIGGNTASNYTAGGVVADTRNLIAAQGTLETTTSATDLAIKGDGFFIVSAPNGTPVLTRAGSFIPDASGDLVNTAGFKLMGYSLANGTPNVAINQLNGLAVINVGQGPLQATPTTSGTLSSNLPSTATGVAAANLPSANVATSTYTDKTSVVAYDNLGAPVTLDVYMTKMAPPAAANTWELAVYNQADAAAGGGFPYSSAALSTSTMTFSATNGKLTSTPSISLNIPNGQTTTIDISSMTQLDAAYTPIAASTNGNAPSKFDHVDIAADGTLYKIYADGTQQAAYTIPLATVASSDLLTPLAGNVYEPSIGSGSVLLGSAGSGNFGTIQSSSLELSTVDLATELTAMIEAQHGYQANSKVFQTGSDLIDILVNLKR